MSDTDNKSMWTEETRDLVSQYVHGSLRSFDSNATERVINTILSDPQPADSSELQWLREFFMSNDMRRATVVDLRRSVHAVRLIAAGNILLPSAMSDDNGGLEA